MDLRADELTVTVGGRKLIADLSLDVPEGTVVGLVGPNGSGKSTTLRCVYRALRPSSGAVLVGGSNVWRLPAREAARRVAALTQENHVEFDFTAAEVVAMGRAPHQRGLAAETGTDRTICADALRRVGATHLAARGFLSLSGGERQRVLVARALAQRPRVLVLDEPTNHLDIRYQLEVLALVRGTGITTLAALHDLNLAATACDLLYLLSEGAVVASGPPRDVLTPELVAEVFGVRAHVVTHPVLDAPQLVFTATTTEE